MFSLCFGIQWPSRPAIKAPILKLGSAATNQYLTSMASAPGNIHHNSDPSEPPATKQRAQEMSSLVASFGTDFTPKKNRVLGQKRLAGQKQCCFLQKHDGRLGLLGFQEKSAPRDPNPTSHVKHASAASARPAVGLLFLLLQGDPQSLKSLTALLS